MAQIRGIPISPITGELDLRSNPDSLAPGALRFRQNFQAVNTKTLRRGLGWSKLFSAASYNNADFHDQLLTFGGNAREPVTMLAEVQNSLDVRYLYLATQSRILQLNQDSGNWKLLGSGYGGGTGVDTTGPRFQGGSLGDYVMLTNGLDAPIYSVIGQTSPDTSLVALNTIPDMELIGLETANKLWVWNNCVFWADVTMEGTRLRHRLVWSDYNAPISLDPSIAGSITGYQDLDFGERILNGKACGNEFLIYTDRNIWAMYVNQGGTGPVFGFRKLPGITAEVCMAYENALVDVGDGHIYMGKNRLYFFNQWIGLPDPLEWVFNALPWLYDNIVAGACAAPVAAYCNKEAYFSVLTKNSPNGLPDVTLRLHKDFRMVDTIDAGFSALATLRPQDIPVLRDWIVKENVCTAASMKASGYGWNNEGLSNPAPAPSAAFTPTCLYTHVTKVVGNMTVEDTSQSNPASDSLCALLTSQGSTNVGDFCGKCDAQPVLVAASSVDWCLKQIGDEFNPIFYRERCTNPTAVGTTGTLGYTSAAGTYSLDGYSSIIRFAPLFGESVLVTVQKILLNYTSTMAGEIKARIGVSGQVADPNTDTTCIKWFPLTVKQMKCLSTLKPGDLKNNTVPDKELRWDFKFSGKFVYLELAIAGTGNDCLLSGIVANASSERIKY